MSTFHDDASYFLPPRWVEWHVQMVLIRDCVEPGHPAGRLRLMRLRRARVFLPKRQISRRRLATRK